MKTMLFNFLKDEQGQDLIEYTLLLAFVALASAALFIGAGNSVSGIWSHQLASGRGQHIRQLEKIFGGRAPAAAPCILRIELPAIVARKCEP